MYSKRKYFLPEVVREDEELSEEGAEEDDDDDDIDNILEDEFPKDEEVMSEEDEEQETDALERLKGELGEKYEADMTNLQVIQVINFPLFFIIRKWHLRMKQKKFGLCLGYSFNVSKEMCVLGLYSLLSILLSIVKTS